MVKRTIQPIKESKKWQLAIILDNILTENNKLQQKETSSESTAMQRPTYFNSSNHWNNAQNTLNLKILVLRE